MGKVSDSITCLTHEDLPPEDPPILGQMGTWVRYGFARGWLPDGEAKPMEDALVVGVDGHRLIGFVADAHGGSEASRVAAKAVTELLRYEGATAGEIVGTALEELAELEANEEEVMPCQTTLLAVVADPKEGVLEVASLGDSLCILLRDGLAYCINRPDHQWAGAWTAARYLDPRQWPEEKLPWWPLRVSLEAEDRILVATDGVTEPIYRVKCVTEQDLVRLVDEPEDLGSASERLLQEILRRDREHEGVMGRGAEDNVAFVLFEVPLDE